MKVVSSHARLEGNHTNAGLYAFMDTVPICSGYAVAVQLYDWHPTFLCRHKDSTHLAVVSLPSDNWKQDLIDEGWEILQPLTQTR